MSNSKIVLFTGYENEPTTLQDGNKLVVRQAHGTLFFSRDGTPLKGAGGDDKFLACEQCARSTLHHLGVFPNLVSDKDGVRVFELRVSPASEKS